MHFEIGFSEFEFTQRLWLQLNSERLSCRIALENRITTNQLKCEASFAEPIDIQFSLKEIVSIQSYDDVTNSTSYRRLSELETLLRPLLSTLSRTSGTLETWSEEDGCNSRSVKSLHQLNPDLEPILYTFFENLYAVLQKGENFEISEAEALTTALQHDVLLLPRDTEKFRQEYIQSVTRLLDSSELLKAAAASRLPLRIEDLLVYVKGATTTSTKAQKLL